MCLAPKAVDQRCNEHCTAYRLDATSLQYVLRAVHVDKARELLGTELAALVGESYERAYGDMVRVQQLTELEEVIQYTQAHTGRAPRAPRSYAVVTQAKPMNSLCVRYRSSGRADVSCASNHANMTPAVGQ